MSKKFVVLGKLEKSSYVGEEKYNIVYFNPNIDCLEDIPMDTFLTEIDKYMLGVYEIDNDCKALMSDSKVIINNNVKEIVNTLKLFEKKEYENMRFKTKIISI